MMSKAHHSKRAYRIVQSQRIHQQHRLLWIHPSNSFWTNMHWTMHWWRCGLVSLPMLSTRRFYNQIFPFWCCPGIIRWESSMHANKTKQNKRTPLLTITISFSATLTLLLITKPFSFSGVYTIRILVFPQDSFASTAPLGFSGATYFLPMTAYLGTAIASSLVGYLSDKQGRKPWMLICLGVGAIGSIVKYLVRKSFWWFCLVNFLNGLFGATCPIA